jgi:2-polyprenyl-3-methyl-5-hydroxy-6-metoxy-1,4-benzoquinol methylase
LQHRPDPQTTSVASEAIVENEHYVIRGGVEGRERLRILGRVVAPSTRALLDRLKLRDGLAVLDVGCGGGDATLELAARVAPSGRVVGIDIDTVKLGIAREEARQRGVAHVDFRESDATSAAASGEFDVVYARFLLTHLGAPADAVASFHRALRPGGIVAVEDIDTRGHFHHPPNASLDRYYGLYDEVARRRGGDPHIGPRLPSLLRDAGFEEIQVAVVHPAGLRGDVKLMAPLTMENVAPAFLEEGLATRAEIDAMVQDLFAFARDESTVSSMPRVVQSWGRKPAR